MHREMFFMCCDEHDREIGDFSIEYVCEKPCIMIAWEKENESGKFEANLANPNEFAYFLRIYFLMWQLDSFASNRFITSQL